MGRARAALSSKTTGKVRFMGRLLDRDCSGFRFLPLLEPLVGLAGLFQADQAVAVEIDADEVLWAAEELAGRDVAVAVDVHRAEPGRAARGRRRRRLSGRR